ncbi:hypothetical protein TNIN_426051 [Trichonephila inaurata madagascariensis]|uniref:Uncharacterized protein n=1 Tax=Trichonephila inaurata madagascariensis TaxID=2747483 RepID=A0A8X6I1Y4_9ARAC|nr:hypothetical protein TNIN_426051 [Trichonephila inaurata madagascariensis]
MMEDEKLKSQASTFAPAPPVNNSAKPQPSIHKPAATKPQPQPKTASKTSQDTSLRGTLKELQDLQVVELLTMKEIVKIAKKDKTQSENAIELCELLGINILSLTACQTSHRHLEC